MNAHPLLKTVKPWLCTLITHAVVMPLHGNCVAANVFMDVPGVGVFKLGMSWIVGGNETEKGNKGGEGEG